MTEIPEQYHAEIVRRTEATVDQVRGEVQAILNGLADRPKPGDKAKAREAATRILRSNADLWRFMEGKKPIRITGG